MSVFAGEFIYFGKSIPAPSACGRPRLRRALRKVKDWGQRIWFKKDFPENQSLCLISKSKMRVKTNHRKSKRVAWIVENPEAGRPMKLLPRNCSTKNALCPTAPTEPRREYQIVLHVTLNHRSSRPGVSSLSNRKERRKWRENTNQEAPEDFPD